MSSGPPSVLDEETYILKPPQETSALPLGGGRQFYAQLGRKKFNVNISLKALVLPWALFCAMHASMSFKLHYLLPAVSLACAAAGFSAVLAAAWLAHKAFRRTFHADPYELHWSAFMFATLAAAWVFGVLFGSMNFNQHCQPFHEYENLEEYRMVDPTGVAGQQIMDASRVTFVEGAGLDISRSAGFKSVHTYCVAPITLKSRMDGPPSGVYDFWAVGMDCCSPDAADFHCGEYQNPGARSGLRALRDEDRSFYRLAVQKAQEAYAVQASHPLFFYWMESPARELESMHHDVFKYFFLGMIAHFLWQLLVVVLATLSFSKFGEP